MDYYKLAAEMREERKALDFAIVAMEALAAGKRNPRGRPPKWLAEARKEAESATEEVPRMPQ